MKKIRQEVWRGIIKIYYYSLEGDIDSVIKLLQSYKQEYPNKVLRLEVEYELHEERDYLELQYRDIETDEEYSQRISKERIEDDNIERQERAQLEKLKKKYGGELK